MSGTGNRSGNGGGHGRGGQAGGAGGQAGAKSAKPSISPARTAAFDILLRVERDGAYAGELLNAPRMDKLGREDRALAYELVMSSLRWQRSLDALIARYCTQPLHRLDAEVRAALRLGICQLTRLDRIPAHAAVHESVELVKAAGKRSAAPLVNAVLRNVAAHPKAVEPARAGAAAALAADFAHPEWMVARWIAAYGGGAVRAISEADQVAPQSSLRLCATETATAESIEDELHAAGIETAPGALLSSARRLVRGDLSHSEAFRQGRVAVQDEGSQLVAMLVGHGERILDCCAAPGGKTQLIAARNPLAQITAVELHEHRARALRQRLGEGNVKVIDGDVTALGFDGAFDRVLADVPCSGTGTLASNPEIKWRLDAEQLPALQDLQVSILRKAASLLAPGGRLVYSTCSLEAEECEQVVERVLGEQPALRVLPCLVVLEELRAAGELACDPATLVRGDFLRTLPGVHPCEGFFAAVMVRE